MSLATLRRGRPALPRPFTLDPLFLASGATTFAGFARQIGIARKNVYHARHQGLTEAQADRWAHRLGLHPCEVWGDQWWNQT